MKKIFTSITVLLIYTSVYAQNPVPNPGFELWTNTEPDFWGTINSPPDFPITSISPAHSGSLALKGEVIALGPGSTLAPFVASTSGGTGFAVSQSYTDLTFWYKALVQPGEVFETDILFSDSAGNTVGYATHGIPVAAASYTKATVSITSLGGAPVTCVIIFTIVGSGAGALTAGSYFIVDDVSLNTTTGIQNPIAANDKLVLFPNPVNDVLHLSLKNMPGVNGQSTVIINDLSGRTVLKKEVWYNGTDRELAVDVSELTHGAYVVQLISGNVTARSMFTRQ